MKTHTLLSASLAATLLPLSAVTASAAPLVLNNVSAKVAAARLSANYHVDIVLKANAARHVNVALDDADDAGARLQTVNSLSNALRLDFTKTIVVSKGTSSVTDPAAVDSAASIPFGRTIMPAREAITLIAGVDDAFARIAGDVGGVVTFSKPILTIGEAEEEVAKQTGTKWRAVYVLTPRNLVSWVASPLLIFPDRQREAQERREEEAEDRQDAQQQAVAYQAYQQALAQRQASLQAAARTNSSGAQAMSAEAMNGMGYYPNGSGSYGNSYQNGGYTNGGYTNGGYTNSLGGAMDTSGNAGGNFSNHVAGGN